MISPTNYDFQWARSELVIIYQDSMDPLWAQQVSIASLY